MTLGAVPVYSVATSPLKASEDHLVGESIVFSTDSILRGCGRILHGHTACVIGFGQVGRSISRALHLKHLNVAVVESDSVRAVEASGLGYRVVPLDSALGSSDFVFSSTGQQALTVDHLSQLRAGAFVFSVTSSDDEFNTADLESTYAAESVGEHVVRYSTGAHHFHLVNGGNAVNFVHGAVVGPYIRLVQGEILVALGRLLSGRVQAGIQEVDVDARRKVAAHWLETFHDPAGTVL